MFILDLSEQSPVETTITVDGDTSFTLSINRPSLDDVLIDSASLTDATILRPGMFAEISRERFSRRLDRVVGWSGISSPNGDPVPFNRDSLNRLLARSPQIVDQVGQALRKLYGGDPLATPSASDQASDGETVPVQ